MSAPDGEGLGDLHSHLIPGVDDGARDVAEGLEGVALMVDAGIRQIVTTPHFEGSLTREPEAFRARMDRMDEGWRKISDAVRARWPDLAFHRGNEVMLDTPDVDLSDERIRLAGTSFALVEWPRFQVPPRTPEVVSRLRSAGYRPVIAHPERYRGVDPELAVVRAWRREGAYLQLTHGSLVGRYGEEVRARAFRLLRHGLVDFLSTDYHARPGGRVFVDEARQTLEKQDGDEHFALLARTNPLRMLRDEEPLPVPRFELEGGLWSRLKGLFSAEPG